jgi:HEAT repeat protein
MFNNDDELEEIPIAYSIDNAILMHRDIHFGGDFSIMLDYYKKGGKGVNKEFAIERIEEMYQTEQKTGKNLSVLMLSGAEAEKVAKIRKAYQDLRDLYSKKSAKNRIPKLIADLILAEDEETERAIQACVAEKSAIVPALIDLLRSKEFYDPLYPGYGDAPALAAKCLGMIGDKRAIISLFEAIGEEDFFNEDIILEALQTIGEPAKAFLLKVLHARPITSDNEHAAVALISFRNDPEVSAFCLNMLKDLDLKKQAPLATYMVLACEGLSEPSQQKLLLEMADQPNTPKTLRQDILAVAKSWSQPPGVSLIPGWPKA